jgi:type I restriction enzyme S subunit
MILSALRDLGQITTGSTPSTKDPALYGGDLPFITPADLGSSVEITAGSRTLSSKGAAVARVLPSGTVLVCCIGTVGKVGIAGLPVATNQQINAITFDPAKVHPRFGLYACQTLGPQLAKVVSSTTLPIVSKSKFAALMIPVPPLDEQRRIAAILDKADELRIKRRKALSHLETLAQSLFHSMFGDPDPEKDGQPLRSLVSQGDGINYGVIQPGADVAGGKPLIRVSDLALGGVRLTHLKAIAPEIEAQYRRSRLKGTEILVSCVGTIGEIATTNSDVIGFNIARAVARVPIDRPSLRLYVAEYLRTARVKRYFTKELRTVSQPTLNIKQLGDTLVIVPPEDQQDLFAERVSAIERLKDHHREQLDELDALFASLQNQAFKAEL